MKRDAFSTSSAMGSREALAAALWCVFQVRGIIHALEVQLSQLSYHQTQRRKAMIVQDVSNAVHQHLRRRRHAALLVPAVHILWRKARERSGVQQVHEPCQLGHT